MALKQPRSAFIVLRMHTIAEPKAEGFWPCDVGRRAAQEIDNCTYRSVVGCMMWGHLAGRLAAANASPAIVLSFVCLRGCVTAAAQGRASPPRESKGRTTLWPLPRHLTRPARYGAVKRLLINRSGARL